ncbi:PAS domain-containing protein [Streptomyces longispororuber]|uniref:PAS domain-containing protein n=1 Tax=Streptomyces longispororuber TaxID=68230 RepID=UPI00167E473A|nr:PAS domain-containing protein [Streptomyces longispororuber]
MHEVLTATSESRLFEVTAAPYVVLDTDMFIRGVNAAYLRATERSRDELIGAFMFDAFPDDPGDATATGVRDLSASLERVLSRGASDDMGIQPYSIPASRVSGAFRRKVWSPVNSPLIDAEGRVVGALHHVEDVTAVHEALREARNGAAVTGSWQPPGLVRRAMLAVTRYERAARAVVAGQATPGGPARDGAGPASLARRDALWHAVVHAARQAPSGGCAAAVCGAAVTALPGTDAAVITLHGGGRMPEHLAVSSAWARRVEEVQYVTGDGPSLAAFDTGERVLVADLDRSGTVWPLFTEAALGLGVGAAFAYPLRTATATLGTLTLYRRRRGARGQGPPAQAETLAQIITSVLLADMDSEIIEQVRATADQDDLHVAAGIVAATLGIGTGEALQWLRVRAQAQRVSVVDLARSLIAHPPPDPGSPL